MTLYVSAQNTGFVMTNELGHLHNLASVFSETLDTPQALILAGENYQSVYEVLTKKNAFQTAWEKGLRGLQRGITKSQVFRPALYPATTPA